MAEELLLENGDMLSVSTPAETRNVPGNKRGFVHRKIEWLFSPELFHLKLLLGTAVGVWLFTTLRAKSLDKGDGIFRVTVT